MTSEPRSKSISSPLMTSRQSFLISDGKVVWNMLKGTTTETHAKDILKAYEELSKK